MKHLLLALALAACHHAETTAPPAKAASAPSLSGAWAGTVDIPGQALAIQIVLAGDGTGTIDIPQQGASGLALSNVAIAGDAVTFELAQVGAKFAGTLHGDTIVGTMTQEGQAMPFSLARKPADSYVPPPPPKTKLAAAAGAPLVGTWEGDGLVAELAVDDGVVTGAAALPHGCARTPIANLALDAPHVHFQVGAADFDGELAGTSITGTMHAGGQTSRFSLARIARPHEVEVAFASGTATLAGTLTLPDGVARPPVVVLVTGSGPQDRDECVFGVRPFRQLAAHLARHGIATLRYDDRGTASSTGDFHAATAADFADDAEAAVRFLRARADVGRVGILGHSEGGIVAPMVAARNADVAFIVLWAGPGLTMPEVDLEQTADIVRAEGRPAAEVDTEVDHERRVLDALRASTTEAELRAKLHDIVADDAWIAAKVHENWSPWLRWYLTYDPAATLAKVRCPVLAINGGKDVQVRAATNLPAIHRADPEATIVELPGLNHLFQPTKTGAVSEYATNPPVLDAAVLDTTTAWITRLAR